MTESLFPPPDADGIAALEKAWSRSDLDRYLTRWQNSATPQLPERFLRYEKRAMDIGCGFGKYLIQAAADKPDWGFLGVDKGSLRGGSMVQRFQAVGRRNLFGLHTNIIPLAATMPDASLDALTIFYPNPWWPAKHRKKRWSFHPLLPKLARILRPGGTLLITSNEFFYLGEFRYTMAHHPDLRLMTETYAGPIQVTEGRTHFETKFLNEGVPCGELIFRRDV